MAFKSSGRTGEYIRDVLSKETNEILLKLDDYAKPRFIPILLPETAAFLRQLIHLKQPSKILEIGTAIGYSGSVMLLVCEKSELYTVEINEDYALKAKEFFALAGLSKRANVFVGDAGDIVPFVEGEFDFIFVDGPKTRYIEYLPYLKKRLKKDGILLCDNILFNGMVTGERDAGKKLSIVKKLDLFLRTLCADNDFMTSILPVGDGLSLSVKMN